MIDYITLIEIIWDNAKIKKIKSIFNAYKKINIKKVKLGKVETL